uniref:Ground-like domain-containing protein n=1 Tax=Parastrongyloides trichosuri TaxID=131310 RepID=A0A0N4ZTF6_PARTI
MLFKVLILIIYVNIVNGFLFGGLGGGGGSSCCSSSCCSPQTSSCGCSSGASYSSCGGGSYSGGCSFGCGASSSGCSSPPSYPSNCGGGCSSAPSYPSNCGGGCSSSYSTQTGGGCNTGYAPQSSSCTPSSYSSVPVQTYQQQSYQQPAVQQVQMPETYHQPAVQVQMQPAQTYQSAPVAPPQTFSQQQSYANEPQAQANVAPASTGYSEVAHHAAADINVEVKSSEDEQNNGDKKSSSDILESEIPPVPIDQIPLINDEDCNVAELRDIMKKSIIGDINISKRKIQVEAEKKFGGRFDVICATHDFSYLSNTELYCQVSSKINNMIFSCYSYRQL